MRDSYDQEWTYEDRKGLEQSCQARFLISIFMVQWINVLVTRSKSTSLFKRGFGNPVMNIALLFETLLALILIYIPGLNSGLQLGMLHPLMFLCPMPFVLLMLVYDEIRKAIIRKHPQGWMNTETTF